jgi:hypothetical protein
MLGVTRKVVAGIEPNSDGMTQTEGSANTMFRYDRGTNFQELTPGTPEDNENPAIPAFKSLQRVSAGLYFALFPGVWECSTFRQKAALITSFLSAGAQSDWSIYYWYHPLSRICRPFLTVSYHATLNS